MQTTCDCQAFSSDPLPIPASDQERCGGTGQISEWRDDPRGPAFNDSPDSTAGGGIMPCPGCPDCRDPFHARADVGGEGNASASPVGSGGGRSVHSLAADVSPPSTDQEGERWTIYVCPDCGWATGVKQPLEPYCFGAAHPPRELEAIEVCPASLLDAAEKDAEHWKACAVRERELASGEAYKAILAKLTEAPPGEAEFKDSHAAVALATATTLCAASEARAESAEHARDKALAQRDRLAEGVQRIADGHWVEDDPLKIRDFARNLLHPPSEPRPDSAEGRQG